MYVPVCGGRKVAVDVSCGVSHSTDSFISWDPVTERMWPGRAGDVSSLNSSLARECSEKFASGVW